MNILEVVFGSGLAVILVVLAVAVGWRQRNTLRTLHAQGKMTDEERIFCRNQVRRRLFCSVLMVVLAAMIVGWLLFGLAWPDMNAFPEEDKERAALREKIQLWTVYWIIALFWLLLIILLATFDLLATARLGLRQRRALEIAQRMVLQREAAQRRQQGNGEDR